MVDNDYAYWKKKQKEIIEKIETIKRKQRGVSKYQDLEVMEGEENKIIFAKEIGAQEDNLEDLELELKDVNEVIKQYIRENPQLSQDDTAGECQGIKPPPGQGRGLRA